MTASLIEKLEARKSQSGRPSVWNRALDAAIAILRQHFAEQPKGRDVAGMTCCPKGRIGDGHHCYATTLDEQQAEQPKEAHEYIPIREMLENHLSLSRSQFNNVWVERAIAALDAQPKEASAEVGIAIDSGDMIQIIYDAIYSVKDGEKATAVYKAIRPYLRHPRAKEASAEVVERVARALAKERFQYCQWIEDTESEDYLDAKDEADYVERNWKYFRDAAKAAIAAMEDGSATIAPVAGETDCSTNLTPEGMLVCKAKFISKDRLISDAEMIAATRIDTPASDDWIDWNGGECPVDIGEGVEYECRDGTRLAWEYAGHLRWAHDSQPYDIIRYRIVREGGV